MKWLKLTPDPPQEKDTQPGGSRQGSETQREGSECVIHTICDVLYTLTSVHSEHMIFAKNYEKWVYGQSQMCMEVDGLHPPPSPPGGLPQRGVHPDAHNHIWGGGEGGPSVQLTRMWQNANLFISGKILRDFSSKSPGLLILFNMTSKEEEEGLDPSWMPSAMVPYVLISSEQRTENRFIL